MSDIQNAIRELSTALEGIELPHDFLENYDPLECLSHRHGLETYLVQQKCSTLRCIVKCYDRKVYTSVNESNMLKSFCHKGLPHFMDEFRDEAAVCVVREYVTGLPLDKYIAEYKPSEAQIVTLCVKLCDILIYLHGRQPPVIHRDIKPQNIIIQENGDISLIDFDIARIYSEEAETDTQFIGTRTYAPPEQYGFSQTDNRADIYALGVLLCFMLTGNTDVKKTGIINKRLASIIRRCSAFSPDERFSDAAVVKRMLLDVDGHKQKMLMHTLGVAALVLFLLGIGFALGRYTSFLVPLVSSKGVRFIEPVLEQAVRVQLGKNAKETITEVDLLAVREIYIFGKEVSNTEETFHDGLGGALRDTPRGTLATLEDVVLLPNLEVLYINYQTLADISPISMLKYLTTVSLRSTFVEDISALSNMKYLNRVALFDTRVTDVSALGSCPILYSLDVGKTLISSVGALPELPRLRELSLRQTTFSSLDGIERYENLEQLDLNRALITNLTPLTSLRNLRIVYADESMRGYMESLEGEAFKVKYE